MDARSARTPVAKTASVKAPTRTTFATVPGPGFTPRARLAMTNRDSDHRLPKRERRDATDGLVENIPRREPQVRAQHQRESTGEGAEPQQEPRPLGNGLAEIPRGDCLHASPVH